MPKIKEERSPGSEDPPLSSDDGSPLVERGSSWQFFSPNGNHPSPPPGWNAPGLDVSNWPAASAPLGYGDEAVLGPVAAGLDAHSKPCTVYFRKTFVVESVESADSLILRLRADDGAAVYLNGQEIQRVRLPAGPLDPETFALKALNGSAESDYELFVLNAQHLQAGTNLLAVEVHQRNAKSSDIIFDLDLAVRSLATEWRSAFQSFQGEVVLEDLRRTAFPELPDLAPDWRAKVDAYLMAPAEGRPETPNATD